MINITQESINMIAPNIAAITNAKKIVSKGGFIKLSKTSDNTFIIAECKGSGKSNYIVSADFINSDNPIIRCTCPSRQLPCKHGLALLMAYLDDSAFFEECDIPDDVVQKRQKIELRKEKSINEPKKINKTATQKKLKKQLEGLDVVSSFIEDLLSRGLASITNDSLKIFKDLSKQMGDYYLLGIQSMINGIIIDYENIKDYSTTADKNYKKILQNIVQINSIVKKSREFLNNKIENDDVLLENSMIYDHIGYVWQLAKLKELNLYKQNASIIQISFNVYFDASKNEYVDIGYWVDLSNGEISKTMNFRPLRALNHISKDDTCFDVITTPELYYYPGEINKRIRWNNYSSRTLDAQDLKEIRKYASGDLITVIKLVKSQIKNTLSEKEVAVLIKYKRIGKIGNKYVLEDENSNTIELEDICDGKIEGTLSRLTEMKYNFLFEQQVLFGIMYYNENSKKIQIQPFSVIAENEIIRLLY